jgi:hypothetical protein
MEELALSVAGLIDVLTAGLGFLVLAALLTGYAYLLLRTVFVILYALWVFGSEFFGRLFFNLSRVLGYSS